MIHFIKLDSETDLVCTGRPLSAWDMDDYWTKIPEDVSCPVCLASLELRAATVLAAVRRSG